MNKFERFMMMMIAGAFLLLFIFWSIGYFCNAIYGMKFEINSAWQGFVTLSGAGMVSMMKYFADSWKNSKEGENPYEASKLRRTISNGTGSPPDAGNQGGRC